MTTHLWAELLTTAVVDAQYIDIRILGDALQFALERIGELALRRPTVAHGEHRVVHNAMPGVIDENETLFLVFFPVHDGLVADTSEVLREFLMTHVRLDYDVFRPRA